MEDHGGQNIPEDNRQIENSGKCAEAKSGPQDSLAAEVGLWRAKGFKSSSCHPRGKKPPQAFEF